MARLIHLPERASTTRPRARDLVRDLGPRELSDGFIALLFSATGPVALIMAAGSRGGLSGAELSSWIFGVFLCNGVLTILASWAYRTPLAFFWTIPGTIIVGGSLEHLSFAEVVGAYFVTGLVVTLIGVTGLARWVMDVLPLPIIMAMVAGVFLDFGLGLVSSLWEAPVIVLPMVLTFVLLVARQDLGAKVPPVPAALVLGVLAVTVTGSWGSAGGDLSVLAAPVLISPEFSLRALTELVVPLAITVIVVQNGQGIAVLRGRGHRPPVTTAAIASGVWSLLVAPFGAISSCLTGPTNALIVAGPRPERHWTAAVVTGLGAIVVGLLAPTFVSVILGTPQEFVAALAGLAMLVPLRSAFNVSFSRAGWYGPLVCFLITVADVSLGGVGAEFWGVVIGLGVWYLVDRRSDEP